MLFQLKPTPKQQLATGKLTKSNQIIIPEKWEDFARMTDITSGGQVKKFDPYPYQIKIAELMRDYNCLFIKSRQLGLTESILSVMLHKAVTNPGYNALVFSKTQVDSSNIAMRAKRALESANIKLNTDNLRDLQVRDGGRLRFLNSKPESSRSAESVSDIFYDECSFVPDLQLIRDAATPTQSMLGDVAREYFCSTPNGSVGGQLYYDLASSGNPSKLEDICKAIVAGELPSFYHFIDANGWAKIFIHWESHPIYASRENFLEDIHNKKRVPWETIQREYNLDFSSAEAQYFNPLDLLACQKEGIKEKAATEGCVYIGGLDTQNGGNDYCVLSIWKVKNGTFTKVAGYRRNKGTMEEHLAYIIKWLQRFPGLILGVELNSSGVLYFEQLKRHFPFLKMFGVNVNGSNKGELVGRIKYHIESAKIHWEPKDSFQMDAESFRQMGVQYEAQLGKNDDEISACAVMLEVAQLQGFVGGI
ncbi:phage terminase large subunit family protein [Nostoc sp. UIC 10890]